MLQCVYLTLFHCGNSYCGFHVHFLLERKCGFSSGYVSHTLCLTDCDLEIEVIIRCYVGRFFS